MLKTYFQFKILHHKTLKDLSEQLYNRSLNDEGLFKINVDTKTYPSVT